MLDPTDRPPQQLNALVATLDRHEVEWVMVGSQVLALYGANFQPNDLDVLPKLTDDNLKRVAACLSELRATKAYLDGWGGERGTLDACIGWTPDPATAENLDWLMVTPLGMLDIVIAFASEPYEVAIAYSEKRKIGDAVVSVCDPRRVLVALEARSRTKDAERWREYQRLRKTFGMPPL